MLVRAGQQKAAVAAVPRQHRSAHDRDAAGAADPHGPGRHHPPPPARQLQLGLVVSLVVATVLVLLGLALLHWDGFVRRRGRGRRRRRTPRPSPGAGRPGRRAVVDQRDAVAAAFAGRWGLALAMAAANRMLDYAALVAAVYAVGGRARPSMVLLAYVLSLALALVPVTPGGLGFVEAGLTTILVLAGVEREDRGPGHAALPARLVLAAHPGGRPGLGRMAAARPTGRANQVTDPAPQGSQQARMWTSRRCDWLVTGFS